MFVLNCITKHVLYESGGCIITLLYFFCFVLSITFCSCTCFLFPNFFVRRKLFFCGCSALLKCITDTLDDWFSSATVLCAFGVLHWEREVMPSDTCQYARHAASRLLHKLLSFIEEQYCWFIYKDFWGHRHHGHTLSNIQSSWLDSHWCASVSSENVW